MAYDIHFQPVPADQVTGLKVFSFGFTAALKVQGLQSLVNRWAKTFMTPRGSDPREPGTGTDFADMVGANLDIQSPEIGDVIVISIEEANEQVRQQDLVGDYDSNECLETVTLKALNVREQKDGIDIWVEIVSKEHERLTFHLADIGTR